MTVIIIVLFVGFWASKRPLSKGVRKIVTFLAKNVTIRNPFDFQWFTNGKSKSPKIFIRANCGRSSALPSIAEVSPHDNTNPGPLNCASTIAEEPLNHNI